MWAMAIFVLFLLPCSAQTGEHIDWPRWCGKAYLPPYPDFNPGGQVVEPPKLQHLSLNLRFKPRYNIFLADESEGEFFIHAEASRYYGFPWPYMEKDDDYWPSDVNFTITNTATGEVLIRNMLNSSRTVLKAASDRPVYRYKFDLGKFKPSFAPYEVTLHAAPSFQNKHGSPSWLIEHNFSVKSEIYVLPSKAKGSITRIDNLSGGLLFRNSTPGSKFEPFFPYGFYARCEGFLCDKENYAANIKAYHSLKLKSMVPMMPASETSGHLYGTLDSLNMTYMYDLRQSYKNHSAVREQVEAIKDSDGLYAYWTFDQPDGHSATHVPMWTASSLIKKIDPYHPIAVSLSCDNYYFEEYTKAADIIVADVHPIGASMSASKWHTNCNTTYGNCGCDNCIGNVTDIPTRLGHMAQFERWLNHWPKPKMQSVQARPGGENHLPASPSADEVIAMSALAINHGAKGILPWAWPVDDEITALHSKFAAVMNKGIVKEILSKTTPKRFQLKKHKLLDVSYWLFNRTLMLSVVNLSKDSYVGPLKFDVPHIEPISIQHVLWGNASWDHREVELGYGMKLRAFTLDPMSTNILVSMVCCENYPSLSEDFD
ncbi:uncharacterized protein TrAFT101_008602 [Trichoderma asperellum]|uniref:uncharacterized protein n=1 Tax=Trichoderma asperellum TaxID=101201 RepID=UPI003316965A|nr:hypothetical protein TrAFT101_008602 [Trichoderma asperellum]